MTLNGSPNSGRWCLGSTCNAREGWVPSRVRQRFLAAFVPTAPQLVLVDSEDAGSIAVQPGGRFACYIPVLPSRVSRMMSA
jgi:hypothetical protein